MDCVVAPFDQRKLLPALAVSVTDDPEQNESGPEEVIAAVGFELTVIVAAGIELLELFISPVKTVFALKI